MKILVLCTGNSCRSQMAHGWFESLLGDEDIVRSAGTNPHGLNPIAVEVMHEVGIDISHHESNHVDEYTGERFDYVITVCDNAKESCPVFPGETKRLHWPFDDPASAQGSEAQRREFFRRVRDEIGERVKQWLGSQISL